MRAEGSTILGILAFRELSWYLESRHGPQNRRNIPSQVVLN